MQVFFCHAYHAWGKGTVENTIGRIRRYVPKGESIDEFSDEQIAALEYKLNHTPRKCLGFLTPYEKMMEVLSKTQIFTGGAIQVRMYQFFGYKQCTDSGKQVFVLALILEESNELLTYRSAGNSYQTSEVPKTVGGVYPQLSCPQATFRCIFSV